MDISLVCISGGIFGLLSVISWWDLGVSVVSSGDVVYFLDDIFGNISWFICN